MVGTEQPGYFAEVDAICHIAPKEYMGGVGFNTSATSGKIWLTPVPVMLPVISCTILDPSVEKLGPYFKGKAIKPSGSDQTLQII